MTEQMLFNMLCKAFALGLLSGGGLATIAWVIGSYVSWNELRQRRERRK